MSRSYIFFAFVHNIALVIRREDAATVAAVLLPVVQGDGGSVEDPARLIGCSDILRGWQSSGRKRPGAQDDLAPAHSISGSWMTLAGKVASLANTGRC